MIPPIKLGYKNMNRYIKDVEIKEKLNFVNLKIIAIPNKLRINII